MNAEKRSKPKMRLSDSMTVAPFSSLYLLREGTKNEAAQKEYARPPKQRVFLTPSHLIILVVPKEPSEKVKYTTATLRYPRF